MKTCCLLTAVCAALLLCAVSSAQSLETLWKRYESSARSDKPQDQLKLLTGIKKAAKESGSTWDYYRACEQYSKVRVNVNWKEREEAERQFEKEIEEYDNPVATFNLRRWKTSGDALLNYVKAQAGRLSRGHNPEFYTEDRALVSLQFAQALIPLLENDYEYALWSLYSDCPRAKELLDSQDYPKSAFLEYLAICRENDNMSELRTFSEKYAGKAAALLARNDLLQRRFYDLQQNKVSTVDDFLNLRSECVAFEKDRKSFKGNEKLITDCCENPSQIIKSLESKEIEPIKGSYESICLGLRNLDEAEISLLQEGRTIFKSKVENPRRSFFVLDTVRVDLPDLADGEYDLVCSSGDIRVSSNYTRSSLSLSVRKDRDGYGCYVADSRSGEPMGGCSIISSGNVVGTSAPDGFTRLSCMDAVSFQARMENSLLRLSPVVRCYDRSFEKLDAQELSVHTLLERRAFNPSDTLHFKLIAYQGRKTVENCKLSVVLKDSKGRTVSSKDFLTGEFGSAAGDFVLSGGERNGIWSIQVFNGGTRVSTSTFTVDEFVLPSFRLDWDRQEKLWFPGETVTVTGILKSYSGHDIAGSRISTYVDDELQDGFTISKDGRFSISFKAPDDSLYATSCFVTVKVTEGTGETHEFSTSVRVECRIPLNVKMIDCTEGEFFMEEAVGERLGITDKGKVRLAFGFGGLGRERIKVVYSVYKGGKLYGSGEVNGCGEATVDLEDAPDGVYTLKASASDGRRKTDFGGCFVKAVRSAGDAGFLYRHSGEDAVAVGVSDRPAWIAAEFFDDSARLLSQRVFKVEPGAPLTEVRFPGYGCGTLHLISFRDGRRHYFSRVVSVESEEWSLPLEFTRFLDSTCPGGRYSFSLKTAPGVECAATIFDVSTETINGNLWNPVWTGSARETVSYSSASGNAAISAGRMYKGVRIRGLAAAENSMALLSDAVEEEALSAGGRIDVSPRTDFSPSAAWLPFLRSDSDGAISFSFKNTDRLSTYAVQLFAHDKSMRNSTVRKEMLVTIPVKVSIVPPRFLYEGDVCSFAVEVSNSGESDVSGTVGITLYDGPDRNSLISEASTPITVPAGGNRVFTVPFEVPEGLKTLGIVPYFSSEKGSDAMLVSVPIRPACQMMTESHSALLHSSESRDSLICDLRKAFVNTDGSEASCREISILDMLKEADPEKVTPESDNVLSLVDAYLANLLARKLGAPGLSDASLSELRSRINACRRPGGGWAWFKDMDSSPVITAAVLERIARMTELDASLGGAFGCEEAVRWLDDNRFEKSGRPLWCGALSLEQYLHVRSLYPEVPFKPAADSKSLKAFRKMVRENLVPKKERGLEARILAKARRLGTLRNLLRLEGGKALAKAWGISCSASLRKSCDADIASLLQYAVAHVSGGFYYPNAVMPWRGLLESELYAHTLLCDLLSEDGTAESRDIAEGIRLWIMVQKETQSWGDDPACLEALCCVQEAAPSTLETRVVALSSAYVKRFADILPSGNGFTISRVWMREDESALSEGDSLRVGEKISAQYRIHNDENRSFVRLTVPRPALLQPVNQLSGPCGGWFGVMRSPGGWSVMPHGYRSVLADRSEYWFDSYPEEDTVVTEEFFVSSEGRFSCGVPVVESLYAPHYQANGNASLLSSVNPAESDVSVLLQN